MYNLFLTAREACSTGGNMLGTENLVSTLGENQLILQTSGGVKLLS